MKTLIFIFKKSIGIPLFVWMSIFLLWGMAVEYYSDLSFVNKPYIAQTLTALDLIGIFLKICFIGYLFSIAANVCHSKEKILYPIGLKNAFINGVQITARMIFILLPLFSIELLLWGLNISINTLTYVLLFYIVFVLAPYILMLTETSDKMPYIKGFTAYFKRNASFAFAYLFWASLSFVIYNYFSLFVLQMGNLYSTTRTTLFITLFIPFFTLFYVLFFNAVLLGVFAKKAFGNNEKEEKVPTKESEKKGNEEK